MNQFPQPYSQPPQQKPPKRRNVWQWYKSKGRFAKLGIGCGSLLIVLMICTFSLAAYGSTLPPQKADQPTPTTNNGTSQIATTAKTPTTLVVSSTVKPTEAPTPTAKPTPKPTPKPKPKPTQAPPAALTLSFTCAPAEDYSYGQVCVHTLPGAALTISVVYCTGYRAVSGSLKGTEFANGSGNYTWSWTPETKCRGDATAYVSASWREQSTSNSDVFTVQ